ncbi:MAG: pyridoxamine 5'-phosphate oxidase family protein [Pseudomonadota bacterium]|nr:pyridoxamine 5'-phosphate oxidase family protein [Pseudomonadota bacterium]
MGISRKLSLSPSQVDEIMTTQWNMRIASLGPKTRINLTPMWFGWAGGRIYFFGRGQKIVNLRRNPDCSVIVDRNEVFPELQAVMIQGQARVLEDSSEEDDDPFLAEARRQMGTKYNGGHGGPAIEDPPPNNASAAGRHRRWVVVIPETVVSWDNYKLKALG